MHDISSVKVATFAAVGAGGRHAGNIAPKLIRDTKLSHHGKPELAFVLGEFCPYCATDSWNLAVALSRFGTFQNLTTLSSSPTDYAGSIRTVSFRYSHFHSRYLAFAPIVNEDVNRKQVQRVPRKIRKAWKRLEHGEFAYPFIDFGGRADLTVSSFDPAKLKNLSRARIAADLSNPRRTIAKAIDGSANQMTAAICVMTHEKPSRICNSTTITKIRHSMRHH